MSRYDIPSPEHKAGDLVHGFRVEAVTELSEIRARCYECVHEATGARLLHLHCNDDEKLYAIGFRTPVGDSTGLPHILEHSVLAGSRKYPVKDAFSQLGKTSLATYLNAFTFPDKTIYPVCSALRADYFNLASVYTDLVFHPLVSRKTFMQEGHHLEFEQEGDGSSPLRVTGVVYNEMRGNYSDPESFTWGQLQENIFPDNCYGFDSGGNPDSIPELGYEAFLDFHRSFYSPSNATWFLYGDIPLEENLAFIAGQLEGATRVELDSSIREQPRWPEPRRVDIEYPIGSGEETEDRTFVNLAWVLESNARPDTLILLSVLVEALVGSAAGPLRRALVESGLGQDLSPLTRYDMHYLQTLFVVGLRGSRVEAAAAIEELCLETLAGLAEKGIEPSIVEAAFHQIELEGREIKRSYPIELLVRAAGPLNYGVDPKTGLELGALMDRARSRYASDPGVFGRLIKEWLLGNTHRLLLVARPSAEMAARQEAALREAMAARKARMGSEELATIAREARELKEAQERPDPPETLALLPRLDLADVPRRVFVVPVARREAAGRSYLEHEFFSNGLGYLDLAFDVSDLSAEESIWLPFLGRAVTGMGSGGLDYASMATRIAGRTGGISYQCLAGTELRGDGVYQRLSFRGKALGRNLGELASIFRDLLTEGDLGDLARLADLAHEAHNRLFQGVVGAGHVFAASRAASSLGLPFLRREQWEGVSQLRFLAALAKRADSEPAWLASKLGALRDRIFTRDRLVLGATGDPELLSALRPGAESIAAALPRGEAAAPEAAAPEAALGGSTGVAIGAQVNYVAKVLPLPNLLHPDAGALELLCGILSENYLYEKLRVQGGAYGGFSSYNPRNGTLSMMSYRDPRLAETIEVFDGAPEFFRSGDFGEAMLERVRVGLIGDGAIRSAAEAGSFALVQSLSGVGDGDRQTLRDRLFSVSAKDIRDKALPLFEEALKGAPQAALGSREALDGANERLIRKLAIESLE
jgi:presequence protease